MQKIISVKKKHIKNGIRDEVDSCPVALALKDAGYTEANVLGDAGWVRETYDSNRVDVAFPRSVQRFVNKFDLKGKNKVRPFNFKLNIQE